MNALTSCADQRQHRKEAHDDREHPSDRICGARRRAALRSALKRHLDDAETKPVDLVELPIFDMELMLGGRIRREVLAELQRVCGGRSLSYSIHAPIAINLMDHPGRLALHLDVLKASLEITAELGARHMVMHTGICAHGLARGDRRGL